MINRIQFDAMVSIANLSGADGAKMERLPLSYNVSDVDVCISALEDSGLVNDYLLTNLGRAALEPYRVKRAIFLAAGFGSRLVPITISTPKPLIRVDGVRIIDRLIDACLAVDIEEIYIVRGYLSENFDQLLYKYPMVKFIDNPMYGEANNISSAFLVRDLLSNAYVFEADLLLSNPSIIKKYHYTSNFLGIKKEQSDDWCFRVEDGIIKEEMVSGTGNDIWQMVGISYWNEEDGCRLSRDIASVYSEPNGKDSYWEQVPLVYCKENYSVEVRECFESDIVEIDTFDELKAIDKAYDV